MKPGLTLTLLLASLTHAGSVLAPVTPEDFFLSPETPVRLIRSLPLMPHCPG